MTVGFPLLLLPLAICNIIAFLMPEVLLTAVVGSIGLPSGTRWQISISDALIAMAALLLLLELIKASRPGSRYFTDHLLSLIVASAAAAEFVLLPQFGNSTFFLLTLLAFVDFAAGVAFRLRRYRRVTQPVVPEPVAAAPVAPAPVPVTPAPAPVAPAPVAPAPIPTAPAPKPVAVEPVAVAPVVKTEPVVDMPKPIVTPPIVTSPAAPSVLIPASEAPAVNPQTRYPAPDASESDSEISSVLVPGLSDKQREDKAAADAKPKPPSSPIV